MAAPPVRFATTSDGVRIAYTTVGSGPPVFWIPHYLVSHVQLEWEFPQGFIYRYLSERFTVIRFDARGLGLSDRGIGDISPEARMRDLGAVARKLGIERFALIGIQGGGNVAAFYAASHPEAVSRLVLINWSPFHKDEAWEGRRGALGMLMFRDWDLMVESVGGTSFGHDNPIASGYGRLIRATLDRDTAIRYGNQFLDEEPAAILPSIAAESLVVFSTDNVYVERDSARAAAATIPNCGFTAFEGGIADHIRPMLKAVADFLEPEASEVAPVADAQVALLTAREREILVLVAEGLSNRRIAEQLVLSPRTVERHLENLYRKTGAHSRAEAIAFAHSHGLVGH